MNIFLSYASEQSDIAERIEVALRSEGHVVFRDRSSLPTGDAYHERIRTAIAEADLFLFLISPESVTQGRYTITELDLANERWSNPAGHILPVVVRATDKATIPAYLKAVTLLEPQGNVEAEVAAAVARLTVEPRRRSIRKWAPALVVLGLALVIGVSFAMRSSMEHARVARELAREVAAVLDAGRLQSKSGNYSGAWEQYTHALSLAPRDAAIEIEQERLAMDWLENIRVVRGEGTFSAIVEKIQPVLVRCAGSKDVTRSADCVAHLGWGEYLRKREGHGDADPVQHYRHALEIDPANVYGHVMWGHYLLYTGRPVAEAKAHFDQAVASGRERAFVRHFEITGLQNGRDVEAENEMVRVANDMRVKGERLDPGSNETGSDAGRLWDLYYSRVFSRNDRESFLAAISPADHVATFVWLYPSDRIPEGKRDQHLFVLGTLQEHAGDRAKALETFQTLRANLVTRGVLNVGGSLPDGTRAAIARLSK